MAVDPISQQRRAHESKEVDERTLDRAEDRPIHDCQRVGYRKWCRRDDYENGDRKRIGERTNRADFVSDVWLMTNDEIGERKGGC